jgi:hypothetical protein
MANTLPATGIVNALGFESEAPNNFAFATWRAIPYSPDGPAVFLDGSKVPTYQGQLDGDGAFSGVIGDTSQMRPPGVSYMFTINTVTSAPPITLSNVRIAASIPAGSGEDLGDILSAMISPLRIQAGPLVYAYSAAQIVNPTAGCGYINTTDNTTWVFVGAGSVGSWIEVTGGGGAPVGPQYHVAAFNGAASGGSFALGASGLTTDPTGNQLFVPNTIFGSGRVKAYGNDGSPADVSATNISLGTNLAKTNPIQQFINGPAAANMRVWSIFTHPTQLFFSADNDAGANWYWMVVTRNSPGQPSLVELFQALQVDGPVTAQNFLSGTADTTYLLHLASSSHNQALLETTNDAEFALLRFQTPSQAWTIGVPGGSAPGGELPRSFTIYETTGGKVTLQIDQATGQVTIGNAPNGEGLIIDPTGGAAGGGSSGGGPALKSIQGGNLDLTNWGSFTQWLTSDGWGVQIGAQGTAHIDFFNASGALMGSLRGNQWGLYLNGGGLGGLSLALPLTIGDAAGPNDPNVAIKQYHIASINNVVASRAFNTAYQNTSGMTLCVSMTYTTSGSSTGFITANVGPANPPANQVFRDENTASVSGAECSIVLMIPPLWWYSITPGSGEITGIGRWWEWSCP